MRTVRTCNGGGVSDPLLYEIGNSVMSGSVERPNVGDVVPITHYETKIILAYYRIERIEEPKYPGSLWLVYGSICEEPKYET